MKILERYYPENLVFSGATKIRAENLTSRRSDRPVPNQYNIYIGCFERRFQSYSATCLCYSDRVLTVYPEAFGCSQTTSKYAAQWLEEYCSFTPAEIAEVKKLAKSVDFGRDCPLYIER